MLNEQTMQFLRDLKLFGMAKSYDEQCLRTESQALSFDERFGLMLDREITERKNRRLAVLLRAAKLRQNACAEDIDYRHQRGLERSVMANLINCDFIRRGQNLLITGPTGCGKSWLACAIGNTACRQGLGVRYLRYPRLIEELRIAHADGSIGKLLNQIAKIDLLILDDFGINQLSSIERKDLFEIIEDRHKNKATLITTQLPIKHWHEYINEPAIADAIMDRLLNNAHKLELKGESMRANKSNQIDLS
jgi:DNA replication protein DnaC